MSKKKVHYSVDLPQKMQLDAKQSKDYLKYKNNQLRIVVINNNYCKNVMIH